MFIFIFIFNKLQKLIQFLIFIIGKTLVLYITVFKLWYFSIIEFIFDPNYEDLTQLQLIINGWVLISMFLKMLIFLLFIFLFYNYILLFKFLIKKIYYEFKAFLNLFK